MTKAELINRLIAKAGVANESSKEFFDLFLRELATKLSPGESVQYGNIGYFHFRRGKTKKKIKLEENEPEFNFLDLIIYTTKPDLNISSDKNLIFTVPAAFTEEKDELDSHFSLSLDKPVMPQLDDSGSEIEPDESAVRSIDEIKNAVDSQINEIKKLDNVKTEKGILLIGSLGEEHIKLELDESTNDESPQESEDEEKIHSSDVMKSRAWDYGKILSKRVEEHSFLDIEKKKNEEKPTVDPVDEDIIPWKFGKKNWTEIDDSEISDFSDQSDEHKPDTIEDSGDEIDKVINSNEGKETPPEVEPAEPNIDMQDFKVSELEEKDKIGKYERVRSVSSKFNESNASDSSGKGIKEFIKETHREDEKEKKELESAAKVQKLDEKKNKKSKKEKPPRKKTKKPKEIKLNRYERNRHQRKSPLPFILFFIGIVVVAGAIYYYLNNKKKTTLVETENTIPYAERNANTTYVERSYEIPVTYPYKKEDVKISGIDIAVNEKPEVKKVKKPEIKTMKNTTKKPVTDNSNITEQKIGRPADSFSQVEYNIYNYSGVYAVQIAAFRSEKAANELAKKYSNLGYNSFVEEAVIAGRGTWYRVKVGNFKSVVQARSFLNSYRNK